MNSYSIISKILEDAHKENDDGWITTFIGSRATTENEMPLLFSESLMISNLKQEGKLDEKFTLMLNSVMAIRVLSMYIQIMFPEVFLDLSKITHHFIKYLLISKNTLEFNSDISKKLIKHILSIKSVKKYNSITGGTRRRNKKSKTRRLRGGVRQLNLVHLLQRIFIILLICLQDVNSEKGLSGPGVASPSQLVNSGLHVSKVPKLCEASIKLLGNNTASKGPKLCEAPIKLLGNNTSSKPRTSILNTEFPDEYYTNATISQSTINILTRWLIASGLDMRLGEHGMKWDINSNGELDILTTEHEVGLRSSVDGRISKYCQPAAHVHFHPFHFLQSSSPESHKDVWLFASRIFSRGGEQNSIIVTQSGLIVMSANPETTTWISEVYKSDIRPKPGSSFTELQFKSNVLRTIFSDIFTDMYENPDKYYSMITTSGNLWNASLSYREYTIQLTLDKLKAMDPYIKRLFNDSNDMFAKAIQQVFDLHNGTLTFSLRAQIYRWSDLYHGTPVHLVNSKFAAKRSHCTPASFGIPNIYIPRTNAETKSNSTEIKAWVDNILDTSNFGELHRLLLQGNFTTFQAQRTVFSTLLKGILKIKEFNKEWKWPLGHGLGRSEHNGAKYANSSRRHFEDSQEITRIFIGIITGNNTDPAYMDLNKQFKSDIARLMPSY